MIIAEKHDVENRNFIRYNLYAWGAEVVFYFGTYTANGTPMVKVLMRAKFEDNKKAEAFFIKSNTNFTAE